MNALPRPPLHGFGLHPIPTDRMFYLAIELEREARLWKQKGNAWPLLTQKLRDRSNTLLMEWCRRVEAQS